MTPLLIALAVGIAAYVLFMIAVPSAAPEDKDANIKTALNRLYEETRSTENSPENVMREQLQEESAVVRTIFHLPLMSKIYEVGLQAGYQNNLQHLLMLTVIGLAVGIVAAMTMGLGLIGFILSPLLAFFVPYKHCMMRVNKRNRKFIDQFPDALDMIVRSVRSGFPLSTALQMLADNAEEPVKEEFRKVVDDIALGRTLGQALARLSARINEPDIRFFVVVLSVQQETGGNLSEIISNLSGVIRKRKQLRHKITAMTSEGKATGYVLGALPVVVFGTLQIMSPDYLRPFFTETTGHMLLGLAGSLLMTCFFVVRAMINVDI
jgi:tight adherence protein B